MKPIFKLAFIYVLLCITYNSLTAQNIGINGTGGNAHPSALLDIDAVATPSLGVLIPRIALQAVNIAAPVSSPATSLLLYNTASASSGTNAVSPGYYYWDGVKWVRFNTGATASAGWNLLGNAGTTAGTNFIGTTDVVDWVIKTNNIERIRVLSGGNVGIGTTVPNASLTIGSAMGGTALSSNLVTNAGILGTTATNELALASIGFTSGNNISLGMRAYRTAAGTNWTTTAIGFGMDVDNSVRAGASLWLNANGNVGVGTAAPGFKLHVPSGYIGTDYINTTDNAVTSGVTGIIVKQGDNFYRTANAAAINAFLGITAPTGDNLGNHTATTVLNMNGNYIDNAQGSSRFAQSNNTTTDYANAPIQIREAQYAGGLGAKAPRLSFHWGGVIASQIGLESTGRIAILNNPGTAYEDFVANEVYSNQWFRNINSGTGLINQANNTGIFSPSAGVMAIYNNGSLGIGTTSPAQKLSVENGEIQLGEVLAATALGRKLYFSNTANNSDDIYFQRENISSDFSNLQLILGDNVGGDDKFLIKTTASITPLLTVVNNGNVGVGTATPSFKLHVPSGYIGTDYINTSDNAVGSGVTGIMVKQGDNYHRTANAAAINTFLGITAPTGDNLGNHTATTTLNMNGNYIDNAQGSSRFAQSNNTTTDYANAPIQIREAQYGGGLGTKAPRLSFHWGGVAASQIGIESSARIAILNNPGTGYENLVANEIYSNAWFRNINSGTGLYNEANATGIFSPSAGIMAIYNNGSLGIGTTAPTEKLEVQGSVKIVDGTQGAGKVLTSDAAGKASWKNTGLTAPGVTSSWSANATFPPEIYPDGSIQTYGPYTVPTTGWYILSSSRWFYSQNIGANADLGSASFWMQINTSSPSIMDQPGQIYEYRGVSNTASVCPPSGSFVYMIGGTNYYVHQQTYYCQSAGTGERGIIWSFVQ